MDQYGRTSRMPVIENAIVRPRIDALLEQGVQLPAVVVSAGAGFGKTQAVAGFLERSDYRGVWQQLTLLDNLPMRFWESFVYTVSLHRPALADKLENLGFPDSLYKYHRFLRLFTEELYTDEQFVVFVFDDFHLIEDESVIEFFKFFTSAALENICVIFITRKPEPDFLQGKISLLTTDDLRFTRDEAELYFESRNIKIGGAGQEAVYAYTSGWPMALYLVGLSASKENPEAESSLIDSRQAIFKLMEREIFSQYSAPERQFFILLSALNFFPQGLLPQVGDVPNAPALLRENMFASYDGRAKRYYLHQLFLDFLYEKQGSIDKKIMDGTLRGAGDWCRENGFFVDAINYYERCGASDKVLQVLQGFEGLRHSRSDANMLIAYIERFSDDFMRRHIMCRIVYAMLYLNNLNIDEARRQMAIVHAQLDEREETPENSLMRGEAFIGLGLISLSMGEADVAGLFRRADELLPDGSGHWGKNLHLVECSDVLHITNPETGAVEASVSRLFEGMPHMCRVFHGTGRGAEYLARAESHFFRGSLREAQGDAYKALYTAEDEADVADNALFLLLRIFMATGAAKKLDDTVKQMTGAGRRAGDGVPCAQDVALGWFYSEIGEIRKVEDWILYGEESGRPPISVDKDALLQIRCLIEKRDYFKALALTERLEALLSKRSVLISLIHVYVYRAVICCNTDDTDGAERALRAAYGLAHGNGLIMPFVEFGHKTRSMLGRFRECGCAGIPEDWLADVHTKASTYAKRRAYVAARFKDEKAPADYGLTHREIELLRNLSQGLTRDEMASSMYVSPHTVKSMLKTVYNKIGAVNGADAVRIASGADFIL